MYQPTQEDERVRCYNPDSGTYDLYGRWTGETGQFGEHYVIECDDGETRRLHYEDIQPRTSGPNDSTTINNGL